MAEFDDLRQTWLRVYEAFGRGDAALLDALLARGVEVRTIGTDPQEWWDRAQVLRVIPGQVEGMGGPFEMRSGALEAYADGAVGWVADRVAAHLADGATVPFRATGVLHREGGEWKIVQMHWSLAVTNQETLGVDLPT